MIREAGDGPETSRVWSTYKEGETQTCIKLVESAGADVHWRKKPGYDGVQIFKSVHWKKVDEEDPEIDQGIISMNRLSSDFSSIGEVERRVESGKVNCRGASPAGSAGKGWTKGRGVSPASSSGRGRGT